jgi:hypothetical protein
MSTTLSGLIVGVVQGRLLAGVFATYASWRDTYWFAVGIQGGKSWILPQVLRAILMVSDGRRSMARSARYSR